MAFSHTLKAAFIIAAFTLAGTESYAAAGHDSIRGGSITSSTPPMARPVSVDRPKPRPSTSADTSAAKARAKMTKAARDRLDRATVLGVSRTSTSGH